MTTPDEVGPVSEVLIYQSEDGGVRLEVPYGDETVWLSQRQMAALFDKDVRTINEHIKNIFEEQELSPDPTIRDFRIVQVEGSREVEREVTHYNLDVIISVGYRVKSRQGTRFRIWATQQLREYLVKGFLLNDQRFREVGGERYFEELLQRIRDIRSSEKVFYRKVLAIYSTSVDYDKDSEVSREFFKTMQNKMHWAAHGHTAAEIVAKRASAKRPNVGMTNFPGDRPLKSDVSVAKNYLKPVELEALNLIVSLYLDFAELQALNRRPMTMAAWIAKLDDFLRLSERGILTHAGSISHKEAEQKAQAEYEEWRAIEGKKASAAERDFESAISSSKALEPKVRKRKK